VVLDWAEATEMLGGPRALSRFALRVEEYASRAPFAVRIDVVAGVKRYVRFLPSVPANWARREV
jgi:hypothetical protein